MSQGFKLALSIWIVGTAFAGELPAQTKASPDDLEAAPAAAAPAPAPSPAAAVPKAAPGAKPDSASPATPAVAPLPPAGEARVVPDCQTFLASPLEGGMIQVGKKFYFVSPKLPNDKSPGTTYLVEVDLATDKAKRLAGFRGGISASLIGHGRTLDAVSIMDFGGGRPDCGEGKTAATAIRWAEQKVLPSYSIGNYGYVYGDTGGHLADFDKNTVLDIDLATQQKRSLVSFPPGTRPLYIKSLVPFAIYLYNPKTSELVKYVNNSKQPDSTLRLKEGMRLLQQGDKFGILQSEDDGHGLQISQIKDWSGNETSSFDIDLPTGVLAGSLSAQISFQGSQVLLFGKDEASRKSLKRVFLYIGKTLTTTFKAPADAYFGAARFGADRGIGLLLNDATTNVVREFWWVDAGSEVKKIDVIKEKKAAAPAATIKKK